VSKASDAEPCCTNCGVTETGCWRRDKATGVLRCNACGLYWQLKLVERAVDEPCVPKKQTVRA